MDKDADDLITAANILFYMKNEILIEVWRNRDEFARKCDYDLDLMAKTPRKVERSIRNTIVDRTKKKPKIRPERN